MLAVNCRSATTAGAMQPAEFITSMIRSAGYQRRTPRNSCFEKFSCAFVPAEQAEQKNSLPRAEKLSPLSSKNWH